MNGQPDSGQLLPNLLWFGRMLRAAGIPVTPGQMGDWVEALAWLDLSRREDVKQSGRALLVNRREHIALFDAAFDLFWRRWPPPESQGQNGRQGRKPRAGGGRRLGADSADTVEASPESESLFAYSASEILRHKPFAELTPAELAEVRRLIASLDWELAPRRTRRKTPATHGAYLDWRRTMRGSLRYGGEPLKLAQRQRKIKPRRLVVLCDVSGSMERYSRILLQFVYALSRGMGNAEAFVFSTRLTRITPTLHRRGLDATLNEISARASDMGGGTQIGGALKTFNQQWARRILGRGAVVLLISDGWDRGEPQEIRQQMERLHLNTHRLIWLNPLLGSPNYEPLTRGMQAALPLIDDFMPIHNLHSLGQLGDLLRNLDIGYRIMGNPKSARQSISNIQYPHNNHA
ncbi:MAG: VWA domain-containing protein [Caldilineales bacterium]|nr:VWA domain-containing protein [Caldilineales bacterium]